MVDIFLSYAREDRKRAGMLEVALEGCGWKVFSDREIPGGLSWPRYIAAYLKEARSVVVAWSTPAIASDWVYEEASAGKKKEILVPVLFEQVEPPLGFGIIQTVDLSAWDGDVDAPAFVQLVEALRRLLGWPPQQVEGEGGKPPPDHPEDLRETLLKSLQRDRDREVTRSQHLASDSSQGVKDLR